jgi:hypothetical protein
VVVGIGVLCESAKEQDQKRMREKSLFAFGLLRRRWRSGRRGEERGRERDLHMVVRGGGGTDGRAKEGKAGRGKGRG